MYQRIRDLREDEDLTQDQLVKKLGMHKTTYTNYEQGKHTVPLDFAVELAEFYHVSIDYIAGLTNNKMGLVRNELSSEETELLSIFTSLGNVEKGMVLGYITALAEKKDEKKRR
ncbi:MAG: helix-turn-helix transcriptional regulator [Oscillospiraceae bacterium]|nr:helix-turn-helix transcriptional regulator [Oscillospiraceae bacterium]